MALLNPFASTKVIVLQCPSCKSVVEIHVNKEFERDTALVCQKCNVIMKIKEETNERRVIIK